MKRIIIKYLKIVMNKRTINIQFRKTIHDNCNNGPLSLQNCIDLVTVAYNNPDVISQQIRLIKKYFTDPFFYTIADNSLDNNAQIKIRQICSDQGIAYIKLPHNPYSGCNGSNSQAAAMNWVCKNYLISRKAKYIGFLDHDIFPVRSTTVIAKLSNQDIFGFIQDPGDKWYLWAGFCFFNNKFVKILDFFPGNGTDTGGMNWGKIYKYLNKENLIQPVHEYGQLREGDCPQSDWYEIIGDWIHTFNASGWMKVADKSDLVNQLLNKY